MEFAANLQYTLINTALTRSPPPPNKDEVHKVYKICKGCLTCNTQHCVQGGGGSTTITFSSPKTQSVRNVFTRIVSALESCLLTKRKVNIGIFSWIPDGIRAKQSTNIENHSNLRDICSCLVKNGHCAFYLVHGNYDELLQLSNVVAFNHNDDYNKQIAVRENDIVYIPAPVT